MDVPRSPHPSDAGVDRQVPTDDQPGQDVLEAAFPPIDVPTPKVKLPTPNQAEKMLIRELKRRFPPRSDGRVLSARNLRALDRVLLDGALTGTVAGYSVGHDRECGCGATDDDPFAVDLAAGTCTCHLFADGVTPCEHMLAVSISIQMHAAERAWREAHPDNCIRPMCARKRPTWLGDLHRLCLTCDHALMSILENMDRRRDKLDAIKWRVTRIIEGRRDDDTEAVAS